MIAFGRGLRRQFQLENGTAFLNHGSYGAAPRRVLAAAGRWRARMEANPDRFMRLVLPRALRAVEGELAAGASLATALDAGHALLTGVAGVEVEYLAALNPETAEEAGGTVATVGGADPREVIIAAAVRVGATRLIDNVHVSLP